MYGVPCEDQTLNKQQIVLQFSNLEIWE